MELLGRSRCCCVGFCVLATETLDASGGIYEALLAGKKRMAIGADFDVDVALVRGTGLKIVSAGTVNVDCFVVWVNRFFRHLSWVNLS